MRNVYKWYKNSIQRSRDCSSMYVYLCRTTSRWQHLIIKTTHWVNRRDCSLPEGEDKLRLLNHLELLLMKYVH